MRPHVDQLARDLLEDLGLIPDDGAQIPPPAFAAGHREIGRPLWVQDTGEPSASLLAQTA